MRSSRWLIAAVVALVAGVGVQTLMAVGGKGVHPAKTECRDCHLSGAETSPENATKLVFAQEQLCATCHQRAVKMSHPSGFAPNRTLPPEFPLDWKGDLTCSTCHITHGSDPGMLRGSKRGKDLCMACHDKAFFARMKDSGTSLSAAGHLKLERSSIDIDAYSLHCMGCHTAGGYAGGGAVSVSKNGVLRHSSGAAPHPIGRSYREANKNGDFHPEAELSKKNIQLSEGKIGCVSCHEAYKKEHGKLVVPMDRSALCLACHAI